MSNPEESTIQLSGPSEEPPHYEDILDITLNPNPTLIVRLEVWYFSSDGRSQKRNTELAEVFEQANLEDWDVQEVVVIEPDGAVNRDDFVPLQVDFKHKRYTDSDPQGRVQNHVRELFRSIMPSIIFEFFHNIQRKPHTMSLVARNVPPDHQQRYCQLLIINKLNIRVDQLLTPAGMNAACVGSIVARLSTLNNGLSTLAQVVEIFSLYQLLHQQTVPRFAFIHKEDAGQVFNMRTPALGNIEELVSIGEELKLLYEAHMVQAEAGRTVTGFQSELADTIHNLGRVAEGTLFTPQQLYLTGMNVCTGSIMLSREMRFLGPHLERQIEQYEDDMRRPKNVRFGGAILGAGVGGAILLGGLASNPLGWGVAALLYVGALAAQIKIMPTSTKKEAIKQIQQHFKDLADVFVEARRSVAVAVCEDVFNVRLDNLGQHEQTAILKGFGIDVSALNYDEYRQSLVESSIDKLITYHGELGNVFENMVKVCGQDLRDANIPL
ncbi:hypothetical protein V8C35DRAFT_302934 [Trichoderma chlorosporum]